jgi:putative ABC transport system permease protein
MRRPPWLAAWLLRWWLHPADRDEILGDLEEQFAARAALHGERAAARWYGRQTLGVCWRQRWRRPLANPRPSPIDRRPFADFWMDARHGARLCRRQPRFALGVMAVLALGIGAATAMAAVAYGVLFRPLPVQDEASLAVVYDVRRGVADAAPISFPRFQAWRASGAFADLAAVSYARADLSGAEGPERVMAARVSDNFFAVLGMSPVLGRMWTVADRAAPDIPAIISDGFWKRRFAADPAVVGRALYEGSRTYVVVGVMPPRFERWRREAHLWVPIERSESPRILGSRGYHIVSPVGRLAPGAVVDVVQARLDALDRPFEQERPFEGHARVVALREDVTDPQLARLLLFASAGVGLTWLVVCANVAGLMATRGAQRTMEVAIRVAVGARRSRILRQLLVESLVIALPSGAAGALLSIWVVDALVAGAPAGLLDAGSVVVDLPVLLFASALTIASAALSGILPAIRMSGAALRSTSQALRLRRRGASVVVVAEIAAALAVLVGASLLVTSAANVDRVPLGFDPNPVLNVHVNLPSARYGSADGKDDGRYLPVQRELLGRLRALPGVEAASIGGIIFVAGGDGRVSVSFDDGRRLLNGNPQERPLAPGHLFVGPDYMSVHGARLVEGRDVTHDDLFGAPPVVLVNETMARMHWPGESPIGKRLNFGLYRPRQGYDEPWAEVIGVVGDIRHAGVAVPARPEVYRSALQYPRQEFDLVLRTSVPPETLVPMVRARIRDVDPEILITATRRLADVVADATSPVRYTSALMSGLAAVTAVLCGFGVFSLLAHATASRQREIGIRLALGADRRRVAIDVIRQAVRLLAAGLLVGVAVAWYAARALESVLFEVTPSDPATFAVAAAAIAVVALVAALVPARRAAQEDPASVLRGE